MVETAPVGSPGHAADPQLEYRSVERWAVGGLVLALLSPLALLSSLLWLLAPLGVLVNAIALRRLHAEPERVGRTAALVGLGLSLVFATLPLGSMAAERILLTHQARPVAEQFLDFLREGSPEKAGMLEISPDVRQPLDDSLWAFYRHNEDPRRRLAKLTHDPTAQALMALGERAQVRFYKMAAVATEGSRAIVNYWYTVTYHDEQGKKKTFLIRMVMERRPTRTPGLDPWQVRDLSSGIDPDTTSR